MDVEPVSTELSATRRALLDALLQEEGLDATADARITPRPQDVDAPLSFAQERLWFLDQLSPGTPFYNIATAVPLRMAIDPTALEQAVNTVVARHEALRTTFPTHDGRPIQAITPTLHIPLTIHDLRPLPTTDRTPEAERLAAQEAGRPFDLTTGPLLRTGLIHLGPTDTVLLLTFHHIVADGWSLGVFARELWTAYTAHATGRPPQLPALPIQYADFAVWQRHWLTGDVLDRQLAYWRTQLDNLPALQLPTDHPRPPFQTFRGAASPVRFPSGTNEAVQALSRREGCTPFMTLLAAFAVLLGRYSREQDIVVGSPIAGRTRPQTEDLIGFFVNTLVLRTDLRGDPTFRQLLGRVREVALGAYANQDLPFEAIVEELQPERDLSQNPLFQIGFVLHNAPSGTATAGGPAPIDVERGSAVFHLALSLWEGPTALEGRIEYSTDLFDASTIDRLGEHLTTLLAALLAAPDAPVSSASMLTARERHRLLVEWNATGTPRDPERCWHDIVAEQVAQNPHATAALFDGERLTYGELDRRANRLAHRLQALGVAPDALVGICMERSFELVVSILAVLKAGGAFVPLDPAYPKQRLAFMLDDARVVALLTHGRLRSALPDTLVPTVAVDDEWPDIALEPDSPPPSDVGPANLAYVIYTSGSTGRPKGVLLQHAGLCTVARGTLEIFQCRPDSRVVQLSSLSFDASVFEIVLAWSAGAALVLGRSEELLPGASLVRFLREQKVTAMLIPPSALAAVPVDDLTSLDTLMVAGEPCPAELIDRWAPNRRVFNLYGPTEATIWLTVAECRAGGGRPPIGRPVAHRRAYAVDETGQPVPIGVPGELWIGGAGLGRGYLRRPELTAERFTTDPFQPGGRVYRTGDLVRWRPDGMLEFIGRLDDQVKVRGFRIEPGEIEAALNDVEGVRQSAVTVREDTPGDRRLVAYVVPETSNDASTTIATADVTGPAEPSDILGPTNELAQPALVGSQLAELGPVLRRRLPEHMIPSAFVALERLPILPSGKLDRARLPPPNGDRPNLTVAYVPPSSDAEKALARIWSEILGVDRVGVRDNFFDLGGHSLLATRLISRVRDTFQLDLPLRLVFESAGLGEMAAAVEQTMLDEIEAMSEQDAERLLDESATG